MELDELTSKLDGVSGEHARTTKYIAFSLLGAFSIGLLILLGGALHYISSKPEQANSLLELFKAGFLIMGGSLSSVVGYYFGSRSAQTSEEEARRALLELEGKGRLLEKAEAYIIAQSSALKDVNSDAAEAEGLRNDGDVDGIEEFRPTDRQGNNG